MSVFQTDLHELHAIKVLVIIIIIFPLFFTVKKGYSIFHESYTVIFFVYLLKDLI